jgi:hypothetical protein
LQSLIDKSAKALRELALPAGDGDRLGECHFPFGFGLRLLGVSGGCILKLASSGKRFGVRLILASFISIVSILAAPRGI